jgi:cytosine deaminase
VLLKNVTVPLAAFGQVSGATGKFDIAITDGVVTAIGGVEPASTGGTVYDCEGGLALPAFVDVHTHLDKGHIWPRKENPDGTFMGALMAVGEDRIANWSAADVERRMEFAIRTAFAHGTAAIRTHLDSADSRYTSTWDVFEAMRERWAGRVELQGVALVGPDTMLDKALIRPIAERAKVGGGLMGGACSVFGESRKAMFNVVEMVGEMGLDLDLHTDETLDISAATLFNLAEAVLETGYKGKVQAGHCCVLTVQDAAIVAKTIEAVAKAGIAVVSLPMCNMYLQDRDNARRVRTPRYRGATLVNELKAAGVNVSLSSDNTRDPFYAYGDLDVVEVFREGARITHFDHPAGDAFDWLRAVTSVPAAVGGFAYEGKIEIGKRADLNLFRARTWSELMSRAQSDRIVLRNGIPIDRTLPDYRELDDLME